ncbi:hypothetical protein PG985_009202 [Apiospora marii]|uniref:uncharacterized protein n=1 Tax=Apiospora marii TaxID=335849 RepID=UPI003130A8BC
MSLGLDTPGVCQPHAATAATGISILVPTAYIEGGLRLGGSPYEWVWKSCRYDPTRAMANSYGLVGDWASLNGSTWSTSEPPGNPHPSSNKD